MRLSQILNSTFGSPAEWFINWARGWDTDSVERKVTAEKALSYAPIWYGVNKIAGHIAQLPVTVYKKLDERGAEKDKRHNVQRLIRRPNPYQTSVVFREQIAMHSLLDGNGRAAIVRSGNRIAELLPLLPTCTSTGMLAGVKLHATRPSKDDRLRMFFPTVDDSDDGVIMLDDAQVLHIPGLSMDGINGLSLRQIAQRSLGASINSEKRLANQMESGFSGNLMLQAPPGVFRKQEDAEEFLEAFERRHNSPDKAGKTGMLREGITANMIAMNNKDAEMIEHRKFQRQDAALWLGLEQILGDDSSVSYNSLEQKNLAYLMNCLNKWLSRWEQEMEYKLLPSRQFESESHFIRFNTGALLKSDYKTSVESLAVAIGATIISPNEARDKLDMNPYPGGDVYQNPNTTAGGDSQDAVEETSDSTGNDAEESTQARLAVQARIAHLIGTESKKVTDAASQASKKNLNYLEWVDRWYGKTWEPKLADWLEELGVDRALASVHCEESKRRLLEVTDYSSPETLACNVSKCVSTWKSRASTLGEPQSCLT